LKRTSLAILVAFVLLFGVVAYAYAQVGPHGGYADTTDYCKACHDVHEAGTSFKLLFASTVRDTCNACHDGTYGRDVYVGLAVDHNVDEAGTTNVPGTLVSDPFASTTLTCASCHSPHDSNTVNPFLGDTNYVTQSYAATRTIPAQDYYGQYGTTRTSKLLKQSPWRTTGTWTDYGGGWCSDCHTNRHQGTNLSNHPVNTGTIYDAVWYNTGAGWAQMTLAGPDDTSPTAHNAYQQVATSGVPSTYYPICQQCHEDYRDVESNFAVTTVGYLSSDNPDYKNFPHETEAASMQVETGDDLCLNCHATADLP
jgi:predicted CXXCH cytochrome family protein